MSDGSVRAIHKTKSGIRQYGDDSIDQTIRRYEEMQGGYSDEDYKVMNPGATGVARTKMLTGSTLITDIVPEMTTRQQQYPRGNQPGVMVGEDVDPSTGKPLSKLAPIPLMTPGVMVGVDVNPDTGAAFVPENSWSAVDARTMGMPTPDAIKLKYGGQTETVIDKDYEYKETPVTGTNTGTGDREAPAPRPAPVARDRKAGASEDDRMAAWAKANPKLAAKVRPGQAGYDSIQKYLNPVTDSDVSAFKDDSGYTKKESEAYLKGGSLESVIDSSGISTTITSPHTTSNPESPEDGTSAVPDMSDQHRALDIPGYDPQKFLNSKLSEILGQVSQPKSDKNYF